MRFIYDLGENMAYGKISDEDIKKFAGICKPDPFWQPQKIVCYSYDSLPLCIIDCVYSLTVRYAVAQKAVNAYRFFLRMRNISEHDDSLLEFMNYSRQYGEKAFNAMAFYNNNNKLSGRLKLNVCLDIADKLYHLLGINTLEDFRNYSKKDLLEIVLHSIKGMGTAGVNYLFMLTGDENRCKFDARLKEIILKVLGKNINDDECRHLLEETVNLLRNQYDGLTVRTLDYYLWENKDNLINKSF